METTTSYHSTLKERDSHTWNHLQRVADTGLSPGVVPFSKWFSATRRPLALCINTTTQWCTIDFQYELVPLRSPLLGESKFVSFPPLNDMLKFSG